MSFHSQTVAIIGRPNVGKSSLFNRLIGRRTAIVGDRPGVTVDRLEGSWKLEDRSLVLFDTGGIGEPHGDIMQQGIDTQVQAGLELADLVLFIVDAQAGVTPVDHDIAQRLRRHKMSVLLVVNKAERDPYAVDFYELGLGNPILVSATHGHGIKELKKLVHQSLPKVDEVKEDTDLLARIAVLGRPNAGKSTLINRWLGQDRMVVSPVAGTTRDAIDVDMGYGDQTLRLIDTAGQRKHARIHDAVEFVARVKAHQALMRANVVVMLLDGCEEKIVEQDMRLMSLAHEKGCALIVAVNKMDTLNKEQWEYFANRLDFRMRGLPDVPIMRVSAKKGSGVKALLNEAVAAAGRVNFECSTGELNRWLKQAEQHSYAPSDDGAVVRMKYCTQIATNPPAIKVFSNRPKAIKTSYRRYLERDFRSFFELPGVPIRFIFAGTKNPYEKEQD